LSCPTTNGCAVTRSPEAKALGIPMGEPWFKLAPRAKEWGLVALSSNYELYGDISARVMSCSAGTAPGWRSTASTRRSWGSKAARTNFWPWAGP
jgi:hypothetical protein